MATRLENLTDILSTKEYKPDLCEDKNKECIEYLKMFEPDEYTYLLIKEELDENGKL
jgi:hypothetical protein